MLLQFGKLSSIAWLILAKVNIFIVECGEQRVATYNAIVEVGECMCFLLVHHKSQPETQTSDIHSTLLYIHTKNVVLYDVGLDIYGARVTTLQRTATLIEQIHHTHGECARAYCGIADADSAQRVEKNSALLFCKVVMLLRIIYESIYCRFLHAE